jgi:hypothetical protein
MKPRGLVFTLAAMCVLNLTGYLFIHWNRKHAVTVFALISALIFAGYFVRFFYWQGRNWARILVILDSIVALYGLRYVPRYGALQQAIIVGDALLGAYLIYWLNTRAVRDFFRNRDFEKQA